MTRLVPAVWMPHCEMQRIIVHWTGGGPKCMDVNREHYHILIDQEGEVHRGHYPITANVSTADDDYAAHTRRCNTGSIGVALCGMYGAREKPFDPGKFPLTKGQWNNALLACADLCERYGILPTTKTLLMHCEVEKYLGIPQAGKWDISVLPFDRGDWGGMTPGLEMRARVALLLGNKDTKGD